MTREDSSFFEAMCFSEQPSRVDFWITRSISECFKSIFWTSMSVSYSPTAYYWISILLNMVDGMKAAMGDET